MSKRVEQESAYVLHTRPYRETSLLVEFFTEHYGRVSAVARSSRGPRSRFRGVIQALTPLTISWVGDGELVSLQQAETRGVAPVLTGQALLSSFYVHELLLNLFLRYDPHPQIFHDYEQLLKVLAAPLDLERALRLFEKRLLAVIGYGLVLQHEARNHKPICAEHYYRYDPDHGPILMDRNYQEDMILGQHLLAFADEQLINEETKVAAKKVTRKVINHLLKDKILRSRQVFKQCMSVEEYG